MGDPEADQEQVQKLLAWGKETTIKQLSNGIGDYGFFGGGEGSRGIDHRFGLYESSASLESGWWVGLCESQIGQQLTAFKYVFGCVTPNSDPDEPKPLFPKEEPMPTITSPEKGVTGSGFFVQSFGILNEKYKPALLWLYNRSFRESDFAKGMPYGSINNYPIARFSLWPTGLGT